MKIQMKRGRPKLPAECLTIDASGDWNIYRWDGLTWRTRSGDKISKEIIQWDELPRIRMELVAVLDEEAKR